MPLSRAALLALGSLAASACASEDPSAAGETELASTSMESGGVGTAASTSATPMTSSTAGGTTGGDSTDSGSGGTTSDTGGETRPAIQCDDACRYVTATGRGAMDGSDWDNALPGLPDALERGATYLLADGEYGGHLFADADRGGATITVRKAFEDDHGTDIGWVVGDGDGQAIFDDMQIYSDDYLFEGVRRDADWRTGSVEEYGIVTGNVRLDDGNGQGADRVSFRHVDLHGGGRDTGAGDDVVYGLTGNTDVRFERCAVRDSDRTLFLMRGNWQRLVVDHCYLARNTSTPEVHGEALSMTDSDDVTFSHNAIEDIEGTAVFAALNDGVASNWRIHGNTFVHTADYIADIGRTPGHNYGVAGFVFCANDASNANVCNDFVTRGNTFVDVQGTYSGTIIQQGTGNVTGNNLWYRCERTNNSGVTVEANWYFDTMADGDDSTDKQECTGDCDVFVDLEGRDFHLAAATEPGRMLGPPFDVDPDGTMRGADGVWDRGAFEN